MKQQINLYLPEFKVKKDPLTALLMAQVLGGVVAVMVLVSAWDMITRWRLNSELTDLRATLVEETRTTDDGRNRAYRIPVRPRWFAQSLCDPGSYHLCSG